MLSCFAIWSLGATSLFAPFHPSALSKYRQETPAVAVSSTAVAASPLNGHRPHEEYVAAWKSIESRIRSGFYARKARGAEMEKLLTATKPLAEAATSDAEFKEKVEAMISAFGDSHFDLLTKLDQGYYMFDALVRGNKAEDYPSIGAWFKPAPTGYAVMMVLENSEAAKAGLRPGDVVMTCEGKPFSPVASFDGRADHPVALTYQRGSAIHDCSATPKTVNSLNEFLDATRSSVHIITQGSKKIGYIHLWTQANDSFKNALADAVYGKLADTDSIILDLRDGFGGRPEGFADPFFRPDVKMEWDFGGGKQKQLFGYGRPMALLINGGSRSAKELLSYILKKSHRAKLIGSQTAGHVLGTSPMRITSWCYLEMPMVDVSVDGIRLEKNGVKPDIEVKPELSADGKDLVIERAVKELSRR